MSVDIKPRAYTTTSNDAHQPVGAIEHQRACVATAVADPNAVWDIGALGLEVCLQGAAAVQLLLPALPLRIVHG